MILYRPAEITPLENNKKYDLTWELILSLARQHTAVEPPVRRFVNIFRGYGHCESINCDILHFCYCCLQTYPSNIPQLRSNLSSEGDVVKLRVFCESTPIYFQKGKNELAIIQLWCFWWLTNIFASILITYKRLLVALWWSNEV